MTPENDVDPIVQMIVDILRRGKENEAMNNGGQSAAQLPPRTEPQHAGRPYEDIIAGMSQ